MKLALVGYVPPPKVGHPATFLANMAKFRRTTDLILYSDHEWPDTIRLKVSPEVNRNATFPDGRDNKFGMQNAAFFVGVRLAMDRGYTHMIALEEDSRVGCDDWDSVIWEEYFDVGRPLIAAGTLACYNPCNHSPAATERWNKLVGSNSRRNFPVPTYGFLGANKPGGTSVFPNGALAVYDIRWLVKLYEIGAKPDVKIASEADAWDLDIGVRIWKVFAEESYEVVAYLNSIFSGYGDLVTTEEQRKEMLTSGKVVACHQIKSDWAP